MNKPVPKPRASVVYGTDLNLWGIEQARLLRGRRWTELDVENLAEEIESLGSSQRSELWSRLVVLVQHLLKWEHQPEKRKYGWRNTINEQRISIERLLETSPSLRRYPGEILGRCYVVARAKASEETSISEKAFPEACEYSIDQILDSRFLPGAEEREIV